MALVNDRSGACRLRSRPTALRPAADWFPASYISAPPYRRRCGADNIYAELRDFNNSLQERLSALEVKRIQRAEISMNLTLPSMFRDYVTSDLNSLPPVFWARVANTLHESNNQASYFPVYPLDRFSAQPRFMPRIVHLHFDLTRSCSFCARI